MNTYRNGDWTFTKYDGILNGTPLTHKGSFVFAEGEATGHFHTLIAEKPEDLTIVKLDNGDYIFTAKSDVRVTHPEHSQKVDLIIPAGTWRINQRRETDYFAGVTRRVID